MNGNSQKNTKKKIYHYTLTSTILITSPKPISLGGFVSFLKFLEQQNINPEVTVKFEKVDRAGVKVEEVA